eukprot:1161093-Pelagomonas_calceolata.AAC.5
MQINVKAGGAHAYEGRLEGRMHLREGEAHACVGRHMHVYGDAHTYIKAGGTHADRKVGDAHACEGWRGT